jgi:hypothetical protein
MSTLNLDKWEYRKLGNAGMGATGTFVSADLEALAPLVGQIRNVGLYLPSAPDSLGLSFFWTK